MIKGKGKGMAYHGGKANTGSSLKELNKHCSSPSDVQTKTESSKSMGYGYSPEGMKKGK